MSKLFSRAVHRKGLALLGIGGLVAVSVAVLPAAKAAGPTPFASAIFSASANGSAVHVDALNSGGTRVANAEVAYATSAVNSKGLATQALTETSREVSPARPTKDAFGKGIGLEVGLAQGPTDPGQLQLAAVAENDAPPTVADQDQDLLGPLSLAPLAYASALHAHSHAKWNADTCVLGSDIASGLGYAADAQLIDTGSGASQLQTPVVATDTPTRNVVQTFAHNTFVPNADNSFGLQSQVEQTLAPITLFKGTPNELTIEVAGEWVLTATATGLAGKSTVTYHPANDPSINPSTPILRVIQGGTIAGQLLFQDLGLPVPLINIPGVAEISLGEPPRAIGGAAGSAPTVTDTTVSAAVDVVRIKLLDGSLGDIRVGHMEARAIVPAGGISCPIPVTKSADPSTVTSSTPGGNFTVSITIKNSFDCDLTGVSATDEITRKSGTPTFSIVTGDSHNDPKAGAGATFVNDKSGTHSSATYPALGTIPAGGTKVLKVVIHVASGSGVIQDIATANGTLSCPGGNAIGRAVALTGSFTLLTTVAATKVLARTGGSDIGLFAAAPMVALLAGRRLRRSKRKHA